MSDELKAMLRQAPMNGFAVRTLAYIEKLEAQLAARCSAVSEQTSFQKRVHGWMMDCFSMEICRDRQERNHRFLEEALELVQACGCTASEAHQLADYVYGRDQGDINQEVGGVMVTLAALCLANDIDMHQGGEVELARILQPAIMNKIRAKQAAKPKHSPLPAHPAPGAGAEPQSAPSDALSELEQQFVRVLDGWEENSSSTAAVSALQYALGAVRDAAHRSRGRVMTDLISRSALLAVLREERDAYFNRFFHQDPATGTWEAQLPYEEELEQMDMRIEAVEKFPAVAPIAKLVNNNQVGNLNIIETAPNVTIDIGTDLYALTRPQCATPSSPDVSAPAQRLPE